MTTTAATAATQQIAVDIPLENNTAEVNSLLQKVFPTATGFEPTALEGGATNALFKVKVLEEGKADHYVLLRLNGGNTETLIDRKTEQSLLVQLSDVKQGPKIYCIFNNGYVYEYFEGSVLEPAQLPEHYAGIAKKLAAFHKTRATNIGDKTPAAFINTVRQWANLAKQVTFENDKEKAEILSRINVPALEKELSDIEPLLAGSDIGLCHNDLVAMNIIFNDKTKEYQFIDFEYACYNYTAFDIGNHFCEYCGYELQVEKYPDEQTQDKFIRVYLEEYLGWTPTELDVKTMLAQVNFCILLAHLRWAVWAVVQAKQSLLPLPYLPYAEGRVQWYYETKKALIGESKINQE